MIYPIHQTGRGAPSESGVQMRLKEKAKTHAKWLLEERRLDLMVWMDHELVRLGVATNWDGMPEVFAPLYSEKTGWPGIPIRAMAGLMWPQQAFGLSDEHVVREWPERPCCQFFCVEEFHQHDLAVDFSQISRWRKRIRNEGVEWILKALVEAELCPKTVKPRQMDVIVVDTMVQPTAVDHPTDARLHRKTLHHQGDPLRRRPQPEEDPRSPLASLCPHLDLASSRPQIITSSPCIRGSRRMNRRGHFQGRLPQMSPR